MPRESSGENVVIITGASSGMGKELAFLYARKGAAVTVAARDAPRLEETASRCRELGGRALMAPTDVSDEKQCRALIEKTMAEYGRIDTLVNNAGYGMRATLDELSDFTEFRKLMDVNFMGSVYCTFYALPHIKETKGRIVGVSSVVGKVAVPNNGAYSASKFAMAGFFDSLRVELFDTGVSVTMIYPGLIATEFAERAVLADGTPVGEKARRVYSDKTMSAKRCAGIIFDAVAARKREIIITRQAQVWVKLSKLMPGVMDGILHKWLKKRREKK